MLPEYIDQNEHYRILCDDRRGFWALLVSADMLGQGVPFTPLWAQECTDEATLACLCRWLDVRRGEWQAWGRLAKALGHEAFVSHMSELVAADPPLHVIGTTVQDLDDPCEIAVGEQLQGVAGLRHEVLYRHRFASPAARDAFFRWFNKGGNCHAIGAVLRVGYREGTRAMGGLLDRIATDAGLARKVRPRGRSRREVRFAA